MTEYEAWIAAQGIEDEGWGFARYARGDDMLARCFRDEAIARFSFAIPTGYALEQLRPHGPFLEVGAGTGYWAYELGKAGVDVIATDPDPYGCTPYEDPSLWVEVERLKAVDAIRKYPGRTLLTVWPREWIAEALLEFERQGGRRLVYVGEDGHGCTACPEFYAQLRANWTQLGVIQLPTWSRIHDFGTAYERAR